MEHAVHFNMSRTFDTDDIDKFLSEAPDDEENLTIKAILIAGILTILVCNFELFLTLHYISNVSAD